MLRSIFNNDVKAPPFHPRARYPFADMKPGESWLCKNEKTTSRVSSALSGYAARNGGQWRCRLERAKKTNKVIGVRVWRIK